MADIKAVSTKEAFAPAGPYSQATLTPTLIFVSGQIPLPAHSSSPPANPSDSPPSSPTLTPPHPNSPPPPQSLTAPSSSSTPQPQHPQTISQKTFLCISHIRAILAAAGSSIEKVVKTTVYLTDMERDFRGMNEEYEKWFRGKGDGEGGVGVRPARTCVEVRKLPLGVDVEIECWALP